MVKDSALTLQWLGSPLWHRLQMQQKKKKKKMSEYELTWQVGCVDLGLLTLWTQTSAVRVMLGKRYEINCLGSKV